MKENKHPKFKIGDTVVITIYGTVGKITDLKRLDGMYVYAINGGDSLFLESTLQYLSEYKGNIIEKEQINIEFRYIIGDIVQVKGYGAELFKVIGFRTEIWRYKEDAWEDIVYELARINDGEWLEVGEEELTLIADADSADVFIQKLGLLYTVNNQKKKLHEKEPSTTFRMAEKQKLSERKELNQLIDGLLDLYNDYSLLYKMFQDEEYKQIMKVILRKLQLLVKKGQSLHH